MAEGPPSERIANLPDHDVSTGCAHLISGRSEPVALMFVLSALKSAGLESETLSPSEQRFLGASVLLYVMGRVLGGHWGDLADASQLIDHLNMVGDPWVQDTFIAIQFWLRKISIAFYGLSPNLRVRELTGFVQVESKWFSGSFVESDFMIRKQKIRTLKERFYTAAFEEFVSEQRVEMDPDAMADLEKLKTVLLKMVIAAKELQRPLVSLDKYGLHDLLSLIDSYQATFSSR
jgi:hypothetical protein